MESAEREVEGFFDGIAESYKDKYSGSDAFLNYFFNERLDEAVAGLDFENKKILDIGAGTGNLYDRLISTKRPFEYYACDLAAKMLEASNIPAARRFVGKCYEVPLPERQFDFIFVLGVTTYLDQTELEKTLDFIYDSLSSGGIARITFTNEDSIDWKIRKAFKSLAGRFGPERFVLSQSFDVYPRRYSDVIELVKGRFELSEVVWLNHTVFPFYKLGQRPAVRAAKYIHEANFRPRTFKRMSSDFLVTLTKKEKTSG